MAIKKRKWRELSRRQQIGVVLLGCIQGGLLGVALNDLRHRAGDEIVGGKRLWRMLVFVNWIGPLAYFLVGRKHATTAEQE